MTDPNEPQGPPYRPPGGQEPPLAGGYQYPPPGGYQPPGTGYPPPGGYAPPGGYQYPPTGYQYPPSGYPYRPGGEQPSPPQYGDPYGYTTAPAPTPAARSGLAERLGTRALRRPDPRQGVSLAGVGVGLVVLGVLIWGGDFLTGGGGPDGGGGSDARRLLGIALSLAAVGIGYLLAVRSRHGPLATAGVVASALGMPVLFGFLTFESSGAPSGLPFSLDAVVLVSVAVWILSYLYVPGARGHAFYVGLATVILWIYVLDKAVPEAFSPASLFLSFNPFDTGRQKPDWATVAVLSLLFGVAYYAVGLLLDRRGQRGAAVPFAVAGFLATAVGIAAASADLHEIGVGILLIVAGLVLGAYGAGSGRRFTTWIWAAAVAAGIADIVGKVAGDNTAGGGIALIVCGAGVVILAHLLTTAVHEADDMARQPGVRAIGEHPGH